MKKKPAKRRTVGKAKAEAWKVFSRYIRLRDAVATTGSIDKCKCITCGETFPTFYDKVRKGSYIQAGHAIDGRGKNILFDEDLVNGQCNVCNCIHNGRLSEYALIMVDRLGREWFDEKLIYARRVAKKPWSVGELDEIRDFYQEKVNKLEEK